jgi:hypothetical protein
MRTVGSLAAVALLAACSGDDPPGGTGEGSTSGDVEWLEVEFEGGDWGQFEPVAIGDVLLAMRYADDFWSGFQLMRSTDLGETWNEVDLPGRPEDLQVTNWMSFEIRDGVAILTAASPEEDVFGGVPYVWASANGIDWHGGELSSQPTGATGIDVFNLDDVLYATVSPTMPGFDGSTPFAMWRSEDVGATWSPAQLELDDPQAVSTSQFVEENVLWKDSDARLVLPVGLDPTAQPQPRRTVLLSEDGLTWHLDECPIADLAEYEACVPPETVGDLMFDNEQVSVDGGRTWHDLRLERSDVDGESAAPTIENAVELPSGGWLAQGGNYMASSEPYEFLARSDDGLTWEMLLPTEGRPAASVSAPVRVDDHWLVTFSVTGRDQSLHPSQLYLLDLDGTGLQPIPDTESDARFGTPTVIGDTVLVPAAQDGRNRIVRLTP